MSAVEFDNVANAWASQVVCRHFVFACMDIARGAKHVTVDNCTSLAPISQIVGGRRYAFNIDGQLNLVRNCQSEDGRHSYVTGSRAAGPNVFANSMSTRDWSDIGPHHRWGVGQLYDNVIGGAIRVWDRGNLGSGHGWAGNSVVFYNCQAKMDHAAPGYSAEIVISSPNTGSNYCIGCVTDGKYVSKIPQCCGRGGSFESPGQLRTDIPSLYEAQKKARSVAPPTTHQPTTVSTINVSPTHQPTSDPAPVEGTPEPTSTTSTTTVVPTQPTTQPAIIEQTHQPDMTTTASATSWPSATGPTSSPKVITSTTTVAPAVDCAKKFGKCGGINWTGPTCCEVGSYCFKKSKFYSQCKANP